MANAEFIAKTRLEIENAEMVRNKLVDILNVQREGLSLSAQGLKDGRESISQLNLQYRAINVLSRSWQSAYPNLALLTRGFSALASVGRSILSLITSISVAHLSAAKHAEDTRQAETDAQTAYIKWQDALKTLGPTNPETIRLHEEYNQKARDLKDIYDQGFVDKLNNIGIAVSAMFLAMGSVGQVLTAWTSLRLAAPRLVAMLGPAGWVTLALIAGAVAVYAAYETNFLGIKTEVFDPFIKDTTDSFNKWSEDNKALWADWRTITWSDIKVWLNQTFYGILSWIDRSLDSWNKWVLDVGALFVRLGGEVLDDLGRTFVELGPQLISIFVTSVLGMLTDWGKKIVDFFKWLYGQLVGGSIWPDMLDKMESIANIRLSRIESRFFAFNHNIVRGFQASNEQLAALAAEPREAPVTSEIARLEHGLQFLNAGEAGDRMRVNLGRGMSREQAQAIYDREVAETETARQGILSQIAALKAGGGTTIPSAISGGISIPAATSGGASGPTIIVNIGGSVIRESELYDTISNTLAKKLQGLVR